MGANLWLFTEERPRTGVLIEILQLFCTKKKLVMNVENPAFLVPLIENNRFKFRYELLGVQIPNIKSIYIELAKGYKSFVDYLLYESKTKPTHNQEPFMAIEETKTDSKEGRNVAAFQRGTKFVYLDQYYSPSCHRVILYTHQQKEQETNATVIFGMRLKNFIGVEVIGKNLPQICRKPWVRIDDLIRDKNRIAQRARRGNVALTITKKSEEIVLNCRLSKSSSLSYDPNIGYATMISYALRKLGWKKKIIIREHGMKQDKVNGDNKFSLIANKLKIELDRIEIPYSDFPKNYWREAINDEKNCSIFLDILSNLSNHTRTIYSNHGGAERGYLYDKNGTPHTIKKYISGNKRKGVVRIPDLVIHDGHSNEIANLEGKVHTKIRDGINEIGNFGPIESEYISAHYPDCEISRGVIIFGGNKNLTSKEVVFQLTKNGEIFVHKTAPQSIIKAEKKAFQLSKSTTNLDPLNFLKSPLNYTGGKHRLLPQIMPIMPRNIGVFVDLFGGGFNVGINIDSKSVIYNEIIPQLTELMHYFVLIDEEVFLESIENRISEFNLTKTNSQGYNKLREVYNDNPTPLDLYVLLCFSFNHLIRFNKLMKFNVPFGKNRSSFSKSMKERLILFMKQMKMKTVEIYNLNFVDFPFSALENDDFVYCDPPYFLSTASYNDGKRGFEGWGVKQEKELYKILDSLNERGIRFALSNVIKHKGKENEILSNWAKSYNIHKLEINYNNSNYQIKTRDAETIEVLITNY